MEVKDCFVIMPFSASESHTEEEWTEVFESFFQPAWNVCNVECHRTKVPRGSITKDIIEKLYSASVVLADLTDSNPNVMYELGVRHTFKKPSIMVKTKGSKIPFDVNDYNVFEYEYTPKGLEDLNEHINTVIQDITQYPNKSDNPVWDFMNIGDFVVDQFRKTENIQKMGALAEEIRSNRGGCTRLLEAIKEIKLPGGILEESAHPMTTTNGEELKRSVLAFYPNIKSDALTHLRVTRYIDFVEEDWETLNKIDEFCRWCQLYTSNMGVYQMDESDKKIIGEIDGIMEDGLNVVLKRIQELLELK